jgi:hypothetical protein
VNYWLESDPTLILIVGAVMSRSIVRIVVVYIILTLYSHMAYAQVDIFLDPYDCGTVESASIIAAPPISLYMPTEVIYGYIVIDSVCKSASKEEIIQRLSNMAFDSIQIAMKCYYDMINYDPILFNEYAVYTSGSSNYLADVMTVYRALLDEYSSVRPLSEKDKLILWTPYIYHVRINSQSSRVDSAGKAILGKYCANATIIDAFKGLIVPDPSRQDDVPGEMVNLWWGRELAGSRGATISDSVLYYQHREGFLVPGHEYIVFFDALTKFTDGGNRAYLLCNSPYSTEWMTWVLPVINGDVMDEGEYFGLGTNVQIQVFKDNIQTYRENI